MKKRVVPDSSWTVIVMVMFALLLSPSAFGNGNRGQECEDIEIALQTVVDFSSFTAQGIVTGDLRGTVTFIGDPTSVAPVTGQVLPPTRDAVSFTGELTFFSKHGSVITRNVGVFQPGPFGVGVEFGTVVGGTGKYAHASGVLAFAVEADETGTQFSETGRATICVPDDDDNDGDGRGNSRQGQRRRR